MLRRATMSARLGTETVLEWLLDGAPGATDGASLMERFANAAVAAGIRLNRAAAFLRTLHPSVMGDGYVWRSDVPGIEFREAPYTLLDTDTYRKSPVHRVFATGVEIRCRIAGEEPLEFPALEELRQDGMTDYLALPMRFTSGEVYAVAFATRAADGFSEEELGALRALARPFSRLFEIMALRRIAASLLNAYVGHNAGERILRGKIQRGDIETIRCAIWFSDLRGFTLLSAERQPPEVIAVLNEVFDCQVPAVERHGGEVLKFMGDGMLAIFPLGADRAPAAVSEDAIAASREAFGALDALNEARAARGDARLDFGIALHLGEVAYGNIGGATRLDFTCIGSAVNMAARIQGLTSRLSKRLLLSRELAQSTPLATRPVGSFELKGVPGVTEVFELAS
jgi:adenylate cyclase